MNNGQSPAFTIALQKKCSTCGETKDIDCFYKDKGRKDGHEYVCKVCRRERQRRSKDRINQYRREWSNRNREKVRGYMRTYDSNNREKRRVAAKERRANNPERIAKYHREYVKSSPEKRKAHDAVKRAVKTGKLPRASSLTCKCGKAATEYHHENYEREHWLDVVPLCRSCHKRLHAEPA